MQDDSAEWMAHLRASGQTGPANDGVEVDGDAGRVEHLGLVRPTLEGQQGLGTCSPEQTPPPFFISMLLDRLWRIRDKRITGPEKDAVDACLAAVRELLGGAE